MCLSGIQRETRLYEELGNTGAELKPYELGLAADLLDPRGLGNRRHLTLVLERIDETVQERSKPLDSRLNELNEKVQRLEANSSKNIFARIFRAIDKFFTLIAINSLQGRIRDIEENGNSGKRAVQVLLANVGKQKTLKKAGVFNGVWD